MSEDPARLRALVFGFWTARVIHAAVDLGVFDRLSTGGCEVEEAVARLGVDRGALLQLLRALESLELVRRVGDAFEITPLGRLLARDARGTLRAEVEHFLHPSSWSAWGALGYSVRTGAPAFPAVMGSSAWDYRARHPEAGASFDRMAAALAAEDAEHLAPLLELPEDGVIVDVGGGDGALLGRLLTGRPGLRGISFDRPALLPAAAVRLADLPAEVARRIMLSEGDFRESVPHGGSLYILRAVLHNWPDGQVLSILRACRRVMVPGARLVVAEHLRSGDAFGAFLDLHMLVIHGGRERSAEELSELLREAGFEPSTPRRAPSGMTLLFGAPV